MDEVKTIINKLDAKDNKSAPTVTGSIILLMSSRFPTCFSIFNFYLTINNQYQYNAEFRDCRQWRTLIV